MLVEGLVGSTGPEYSGRMQHRKRRRMRWIGMGVLVGVLSACGVGKQPAANQPAALVGQWQVAEIQGQTVPADAGVTLHMHPGGGLTWTDGCNWHMISATITGTLIAMDT